MADNNPTINELELEKANLENENKYLKMRKMDAELYRKAFEKYEVEMRGTHVLYDRLCNHPDYYTKWRGTFFDTQIKLICSGIFVEYPDLRTDKTLEEIKQLNNKSVIQERIWDIKSGKITNTMNEKLSSTMSMDEYLYARRFGAAVLYSPAKYERFLDGICSFSELMLDPNNPSKKPVYKDVDFPNNIIGLCDAVKAVDGKYQLHLTDPYGECLFPPFDITAEEAELALGRICVVTCTYNHYATEPKLFELQILPFTLTEKLGEYTKDTVVIRRYPQINYQPFPWF